jgi:hypothetical protein
MEMFPPTSVVADAFNQQLDDAGLFARREARPQGVEIGQPGGDLGFIDERPLQRRQLVINLRDPPFRLSDTVVDVGTQRVVRPR